ncbi:unnamed protein product [Cylicocyclus nassatus]|uniref:BZIP domain-containing protein n=1 Tax=Cylicocyclus nassatus TaxID=53992 RepID=A0AA36MHX1_CYLNA|nr:unnamed protein product [Cylicocyclus nassatus]
MYLFLLGLLAVTAAQNCEDLVDFCDALQPICIGSVIQYQLQELQAMADQISNSTSLPALESSLPLVGSENPSGLPLVGSNASSAELKELEQEIIDSLPFLKESLPLIRESLPLIRESLPLIRQLIDPTYYNGDKTTCQQRATCKSCRECPKLREAIAAVVETICPNTCRVCASALSTTHQNARVVFVEPYGNAVDSYSNNDYLTLPSWDYQYSQPFYSGPGSLTFTYSTSSTPSSFVHDSQLSSPSESNYDYEDANLEQQQIYEEIVRECNEIESSQSPSSSCSSFNTSESICSSLSPKPSSGYSAWSPEKKERKKAQNRSSALRYRVKKKKEKEKKLDIISGLRKRNSELKSKVDEVKNEIAILKKLMAELRMLPG